MSVTTGNFDRHAAATDAVARAGTVQLAIETIRDIYGLDHATYHHQPLGGSGPAAPYVKSTYPAEWLTRYLLQGYIQVDPVVLAGFARMLPFDWHELEWGEKAKDFMLDAAQHGLGGNGYSVPLIDKHVRRALLSVNSRMPPLQWRSFVRDNATSFAELGTLLHRRVVEEIYSASDPLPLLNPREIECLNWSAQGYECKVIARRIAISEHTVKDYLKSARHKLGCGTLAQAVGKAIRLGIIQP